MKHNQREFEQDLALDRRKERTYDGYLHLDKLLGSQVRTGDKPHHDEMLFIIQHQVAELWFKLIIHELSAAITNLQQDRLEPCGKILMRVKLVQRQLFEQWGVLETLTPAEYAEFRGVLGSASGFQSLQYRIVEFLMGNKHAGMLKVFEHDPDQWVRLNSVLRAPSLYDEFLRYLARHGHQVPMDCIDRDWSEPYQRHAGLLPVFKEIYENARVYWDQYRMCEVLVDVEESFQLWRFRHLKTVERIIGFKRGTGGSSGVPFLRRALELQFFPEILEVRTHLGG